MHKIWWDDLQYVLAVAERGSLSAAARALGVNHATVLRRVQNFEARLGFDLFERPPGGYRLRPDAREVLTAAQSMGRTVDRLERLAPTIGRGLEGGFRLTTTDSVADAILPRHLRDLARAHPRMHVELVVANQPVDMARAEAEITLRPALTLPDGLAGRKICDMAFRVYAHPDYWAANTSPRHGDHLWLGVIPPLTRSPVSGWLDAHAGASVGFKADSFLSLAQMAEQGLGPAMMPAFLARRSRSLIRSPLFPDETAIGFWAATHPDLMRVERVTAMIDFFVETISRDRALIE